MTIAESLKLDGAFRSVMGRLGEPLRERGPEFDDELRRVRLDTARRCSAWTEIDDDFVARGYRGMSLVSASTDHVYGRYAGTVFQTGSATIVADRSALFFTVDDAGALTFYERDSRTWSEQVAARERRRHR